MICSAALRVSNSLSYAYLGADESSAAKCLDITDLQERCIKLNKELREEVVEITKTLPFNERVYGPIAQLEGDIYKNMMDSVLVTPGAEGRLDYYKDLYN